MEWLLITLTLAIFFNFEELVFEMNSIRKNLKHLCWIVLITFSGCVTTNVTYIDSEKIKEQKVYRIAVVYMKDGSIIDLKGKEPVVKSKFGGKENVIVYSSLNDQKEIIELKDVDRLKIEVTENDVLLTSVIIVGSLVALFLILMILFPIGRFNAAG